MSVDKRRSTAARYNLPIAEINIVVLDQPPGATSRREKSRPVVVFVNRFLAFLQIFLPGAIAIRPSVPIIFSVYYRRARPHGGGDTRRRE